MVFCAFRHAWKIVLIVFFNNILFAIPRTVVITGGPGTGKSTTLRALQQQLALENKKANVFFPEGATEVIKRERAAGNQSPWENLDVFQQNILDFQLKCFMSIAPDVQYAFFDRCFPDGLAYYLHEHKHPIKNLLDVAQTKRLDIIFFLDFPLTRYDIDGIRHEGECEAKMLHERVRQAYEDMCGYKVIRVPAMSVDDRVSFILQTLDRCFGTQEKDVVVPASLRIVVTGGPCAGKTTTINALKEHLSQAIQKNKAVVFAEAATEIIKQEQAQGNASPWENREAFQQKILNLQLSHLASVPQTAEYAFFDRGPADGLAYFLHENKKPLVSLEQVIKDTKMDVIFLLDIPQHAYRSTDIRHEDQQEANKLHERIRQVYEDILGYKTVHVPVMPVDQRVAFIMGTLENMKTNLNTRKTPLCSLVG